MSRSVMFSPSSSIRNLTVPCVAGCDGPMFRIWCSVWRSRSKSSSSGSARRPEMPVIASVPRPDQGLPLLLRVVLAERMALEAVVEQDPAQVRMTAEAHAVEVEDLALHPVGRCVERHGARQLRRGLGDAHLEPQAVV